MPKGAGPGTDNSQAVPRSIGDRIRRTLSPPRDVRLPNPNKAAGMSAMKTLLGGGSLSKGGR